MNIDLMAFFSRNNLPRIKDGPYVINLDDKKSQETHWVSLFMDRNTADSFGIEYIPQEVINKIREKPISHNIFRIQNDDSNMSGFSCISFMEYMFAGKSLLDYAIKLYKIFSFL